MAVSIPVSKAEGSANEENAKHTCRSLQRQQTGMIAFDNIKQMVTEAGKAEPLNKELRVRQYTLQGGGGRWCAAGFCFQESNERRLVFEALHREARNICIVRVYRGPPLEISFARKRSGASDNGLLALKEGAPNCPARLPPKLCWAFEAEACSNESKSSDDERELVASMLNAIPPLCALDEISKA
jgi:hypothetical protein